MCPSRGEQRPLFSPRPALPLASPGTERSWWVRGWRSLGGLVFLWPHVSLPWWESSQEPCGLPAANLYLARGEGPPSPDEGTEIRGSPGPVPALAGLPGRHLKREEERERQALPGHAERGPVAPVRGVRSNFPGSNSTASARHLECSDSRPLAPAFQNVAYPGSEIGSNCVWQIHASLICSSDTQQIASSPWRNTSPKKKQRGNSLCRALSSPRRNPGDSGRMERALRSRHTCRQVWL